MGVWKHTAGEWYSDVNDKGIQTSEKARFYGLSAKLSTPFVSSDKPLVIQYSVKHEQNLDCGGAYIKLLPGGDSFDADSFGGDTPYAVMFGPDVCGTSNKKTHVIFHYDKKSENLLVKKEVNTETDDLTHLYTLVLNPDNTYQVLIDNKSVRKGKLEEDFDFLPPKEIKILKLPSPKIGSMRPRFLIQKTRSQRIGMMLQLRFLILLPQSQKTGMTRMMANGASYD